MPRLGDGPRAREQVVEAIADNGAELAEHPLGELWGLHPDYRPRERSVAPAVDERVLDTVNDI